MVSVLIVDAELNSYFRSFWGIFGWFSVAMSGATYEVLRTLTGVCALGFLAWCSGLIPPRIPSAVQRLTLAGVLVTLLISGVVAGVAERLGYYNPGEVPQELERKPPARQDPACATSSRFCRPSLPWAA